MKKFALVGAAGYIAPRHMEAIAQTQNALDIAYDISDSVGVLDRHFPQAHFYTHFEQFEQALYERNKLQGAAAQNRINYVAVCSPNYLHKSHIRSALQNGADAICEKPLVLLPDDLDDLKVFEKETGKSIYSILQLRLHPAIVALKAKIDAQPSDTKYDVDLTYITSRGHWYLSSWKGDDAKSGGVATNIGVHFYDMLHYIFGDLQENILHYADPQSAAGYLEYDKARVRWFLSTSSDNLPAQAIEKGLSTYRSITIGGEDIEFSGGFTDLHTKAYEAILAGKGFGVDDNRVATQAVYEIRTLNAIGKTGDYHPALDGMK